jgi:diadenosine tetraphosphatase ApaH/serine/threonine PP2A family protein phosphatase
MGDLDAWISVLERGQPLPERDVGAIFLRIESVLASEPNVLQLWSPIVICGDIHGQLDDLLHLLSPQVSGDRSVQRYLFMGDYVDRGHHSLNTFLLLLCLKLKYPENYALLRGNHESRIVSMQYGLSTECQQLYEHSFVFTRCNEVFDLLPVAAVVDRQLFCVHGGLSPEAPFVENITEVNRFVEIPSAGLVADLTWSDPEAVRRWVKNSRGSGYAFGPTQAKEFLALNKIRFVARSHQIAMEGYKWFFPGKRPNGPEAGMVLIVWSAPNYCYNQKNQASILKYGFEYSQENRFCVFGPNPQRIMPEKRSALSYFD